MSMLKEAKKYIFRKEIQGLCQQMKNIKKNQMEALKL